MSGIANDEQLLRFGGERVSRYAELAGVGCIIREAYRSLRNDLFVLIAGLCVMALSYASRNRHQP